MSDTLDNILALNPRSKLLEADILSRLESTQTPEIEAILDGLEEALAMMCVLFFELRPSSNLTVATILENDYFAMVVIYIKRLVYTEHSQKAYVDILTELLLHVGKNSDRQRSEVRSELIAAYILAAAMRNVRYRRRALDNIKYASVLLDDLYTSLRKDATLADIVSVIRHQFAIV